jgi:transposase
MKKIEPKKLKAVNNKTLIVALDIGKETNTGYCRCPDRSEVKPFEFCNNRSGFEKLWECVVKTRLAKGLDEIVIAFESTGAYAEPLLHFLKEKPVRLVQVNPMHTKKLKELHGNSPAKTDLKDPKVIADIIELGHGLTVIIPEGAAAELRRLTQARERAIKRRTALLNQLQEMVFISFPEFLQVMKGVKSKSAQYLLRHCPTSQDIVEQGFETLASILKRVSKGKLGSAKAQALYEAAQHSVGIREGRISVTLEIQEMLSAIEACDNLVGLLEREMSRHLEDIPYSRLILSMKGVGKVTAAGLIGEVGDFNKFHRTKELLKHAGLDLFEISSGKHKGNKRISKRGRPQLRKLLFFAALGTVRKGGIMHDHYQRHLQKGMKRIKALVAIARKLLCIIFALVRRQCEYLENYQELIAAQQLKNAA